MYRIILYCILHPTYVYIPCIQNIRTYTISIYLYLLSIKPHITSTVGKIRPPPPLTKKKHTHRLNEKKNAQVPSPTPAPNPKTGKKQGRCSTHRQKTTPKKTSWPPNIDVVEQLCSSVEKIRAQNGFPRLPLQPKTRVAHTRV